MEFSYLLGAMVVAAITFTICITSVFKGFRETLSLIHPKIEELVHCPWCLSFWGLLVLLLTWEVPIMVFFHVRFFDFMFTLFTMYTVVGMIHYVLLRAYKPVHEFMKGREKEKYDEFLKLLNEEQEKEGYELAEIETSHGYWKVVHNLSSLGLDIEAGFENWSVRVEKEEDATIENLCEYLRSKDPENIVAMPYEEYEKLLEEEGGES